MIRRVPGIAQDSTPSKSKRVPYSESEAGKLTPMTDSVQELSVRQRPARDAFLGKSETPDVAGYFPTRGPFTTKTGEVGGDKQQSTSWNLREKKVR